MNKYRLTTKFGPGEPTIQEYTGLNEALSDASTFMNTWTTWRERTGSLRADGFVELWLNHEVAGYVELERQDTDGQYRRMT